MQLEVKLHCFEGQGPEQSASVVPRHQPKPSQTHRKTCNAPQLMEALCVADSEDGSTHISSRPGSRPTSRPGSFKNRLLMRDPEAGQPGSPGLQRLGLKASHLPLGAHPTEDVPTAAAARLRAGSGDRNESAPGTPLSSHQGETVLHPSAENG